ncbi:hemolymph clottable protein-like [Penaeus indicus]|uniref:hemolymph clottable protein-like n=1 Tax=Penaeus indicus TaxID=29960 RepID=UPI00300C1C19
MIMRALLILLSFLEACRGLQAGLEYRYRYRGRIATGITKVKKQFAGAGIEADVILQVQSPRLTLVQLHHVKVGVHHGAVGCDARQPLPIRYHEDESIGLLQKTFKIVFNDTEHGAQLVAPEEPSWITNIRRAISSIFLLPHLRTPSVKPVFSIYSDTIVGRCKHRFSTTRLPKHLAGFENQRLKTVLEEDEQRSTFSSGQASAKTPTKTRKRPSAKGRNVSKTSPSQATNANATQDSLWRVTRAINFDECQRLVDIKIHADRSTKKSLSRSSVATYILRGEEGLRIERAVVEGSIIAFTNSDQEEGIDTFTNQTVELRAVRRLTEELPMDHDVYPCPWYFEAAHQTGDAYPSVEQAVIGLNLSQRTLEEKKTYILAEIGDLSQRATGGEHRGFPLIKQYTGLVEAVSSLSYEQLNQVFTHLGRELVEAVDGHSGFDLVNVNLWKITVFQQTLISAGTEPALTLILNTLKDNSLPTSEGTVQRLFAQLAVTIKTPTLMPQILEFVKSLTWSRKDRDAKSVAMIEFAKLARTLCLDTRKTEVYGDAECDPGRACGQRLILEEFLPYLEQGIVDQASPMWIRVVHIHALSQLRVPHALAILQPLVLGLSRAEPRLRIQAIRGLSFFSVHPVVRDEVFQLLTSVADNLGENPRVRNMAFLTLTTWAPDLSWWQAAAAATWHEPSIQVANFVSSTITSMANSDTDISKMVSRVAPLAKPAAPASLSFSTNLFLHEYLFSRQCGSDIGVAWLASAEDLFPAHVFLALKTCALYDAVFHSESEMHQRNLARLWLKRSGPKEGGEEVASDEAFDIVVGMFNEIKEQLGVESQRKVLDATWTIKFQQLLRLSLKFIPGARFKTVREFVNAMKSNMGNHVLLFHTFIDSTLVVPTDLGFPLVVKYDGSFVSCTTARLEQPSNPRLDVAPGVPMFLGAEVASDTDHQVSLVAKTLLPWYENLAVGAGLQGGWSLQLPFVVRTSDLTLRHGGGSVSLEPVATQNFNLVAAYNTPFTFVSIRDPNDLITRPDLRTVTLSDLKNYSAPVLPPTLGLRVESLWAGDVPQPQAPGSLFSFGLSSPISYLWNYYVTFDPAASTTKSVVFSFALKHTEATQVPLNQDFGQESQSSADFSQVPQPPADRPEETGDAETSEKMGDFQRRVSQVQQPLTPDSGHVTTVGIEAVLHGIPSRSFQGFLSWAQTSDYNNTASRLQLMFQKNVVEGVLGENQIRTYQICLNAEVVSPKHRLLSSLQEVLLSDFYTPVKVHMHSGSSCDLPPALQIQGFLDVSEHSKKMVREAATAGCSYDPYHPVLDIITTPVYDHVHLTAFWTQEFRNTPLSISNSVYENLVHWLFHPNLSIYNGPQHPGSTLTLNATKNVETSEWSMKTIMPRQVLVANHIHIPGWIETFITPASIQDMLVHSLVNGRHAPVCVLGLGTARTFDGLQFEYHPGECWAVATMHRAGDEEGLVQVRRRKEWEAQVVWRREGLLLHITNSRLLVNGETVDSSDPRYEVVIQENAVMVILNSGPIVKVSDKVEILLSSTYTSEVGGLCGNLDTEAFTDMQGPRGCTYTDPALLTLAWSTPGDGCSSFAFQEKRRAVERYQEDCPRFSYVPTGVSHSNVVINCTEYEYQEEHDVCASGGPQPVSLCQKSSSDQPYSVSEREDETTPWYNCLHM